MISIGVCPEALLAAQLMADLQWQIVILAPLDGAGGIETASVPVFGC